MPERPGSIDLTRLVSYLESYLDTPPITDACPNGLQIEGKTPVRRLVTGVSSCIELFERAAETRADAVLVHHGLFWDGQPTTLTGVQRRRVDPLIRENISLVAYHLPLDKHPEVGNNAVAAVRLGMTEIQPFGEYHGETIGFMGTLAAPIRIRDFSEKCSDLFGQEPLILGHGPQQVRRVGVVSGGAAALVHQAIEEGLDAYITGEPTEWVTNVAREAGIHFVAAGHYATERLGVRALGEHLAEKLGLEVEFVDVPNPV